MAEDLLERLRVRLPVLFAEGLARAGQRGARDPGIARQLAAVGAAEIPALLRVPGLASGSGDIWFAYGRAGLRLCQQPPALTAATVGHALELPQAAARYVLEQAERDPQGIEQAVLGLAWIGSPAALELLATLFFDFGLEITHVPVLGTLRARIAFGRARLAASPEFSIAVDADDLEDAREQGVGPNQLFLAGKVKIDGDVAKAMQLAMVLAQLS